MENNNIIIYKTEDGKTAVSLCAKDGSVWMDQSQLSELFAIQDVANRNVKEYMLQLLKKDSIKK